MAGILDKPTQLMIITGHYGVGKTNLALNMVRDLRMRFPKVTLVDLDIVNPYFRSSDSAAFLEQIDVRLLGPVFGGSNLDTPSLSPGIEVAMASASPEHIVVVDVGGDPDGARALARFHETIAARPYRFIYVINQHRLQTHDSSEALVLLGAIESLSHLKATDVVANSHLKAETTPDMILAAVPFALEVAREAAINLACVTVPRGLEEAVKTGLADSDNVIYPQTESLEVYPVDVLVKTPWE